MNCIIKDKQISIQPVRLSESLSFEDFEQPSRSARLRNLRWMNWYGSSKKRGGNPDHLIRTFKNIGG